jgi:hypothetical protein
MVELGKIRIGKCKENGEELFEILEFINIKDVKDVPREYIIEEPAFVLQDGRLILGGHTIIQIGDKFIKSEIQDIQKYLKNAGPRLTEICRRIETQTRDHSGEYTFTI